MIESWDLKYTIFPTKRLPMKKIKSIEQTERILGQSLNLDLEAALVALYAPDFS